jgi:type IV secretion system protein VirB10
MNDFIQHKAPQPPGLLPKNVQSWLIVSLALLMVAIMWLTGSKKQSQARTAGTLSQAMSPVEVDGTKITEMQGRIQQLQREQLVAQNALTQQNHILGNTSDPSHATAAQPERAEDAIEVERKKRKYLSLFASNVALTYRKQAQATPEITSPSADAAPSSTAPSTSAALQFAQLLKDMQPTSPLPAAVSPPVRSAPAGPAESEQNKKEAPSPAAASTGAAVPATGKTYMLFEGTILETVLLNRLDGAFAGPIECLVTGDVYSLDRQLVLIPAGSKVLGETRKVEAFGQARLAVVFHRLLMPDGYSVSLDQFKGLSQSGDTGLRDQVNNHYLRIFGASLAIGAIGAVTEADTGGLLTQSGTDRLREGFGQSMARSSEQILDRFLNLLPTITIREGHRVKIYLSGDLALPDYQHHNLPNNF